MYLPVFYDYYDVRVMLNRVLYKNLTKISTVNSGHFSQIIYLSARRGNLTHDY